MIWETLRAWADHWRPLSELLLSVFTFFLFATTAWLAATTKALVADTRRSTTLSDQHHQEGLMPICQFIGSVEMIFENKDTPAMKTYYQFDGYIENSGQGPALNVQVDVATSINADWNRTWAINQLGVIGSGRRRRFQRAFLVYDRTNPPARMLPQWEIQIGYLNIFNSRGRNMQTGPFLGLKVDAYINMIEHPPMSNRFPVSISSFQRFGNWLRQQRIRVLGS